MKHSMVYIYSISGTVVLSVLQQLFAVAVHPIGLLVVGVNDLAAVDDHVAFAVVIFGWRRRGRWNPAVVCDSHLILDALLNLFSHRGRVSTPPPQLEQQIAEMATGCLVPVLREGIFEIFRVWVCRWLRLRFGLEEKSTGNKETAEKERKMATANHLRLGPKF